MTFILKRYNIDTHINKIPYMILGKKLRRARIVAGLTQNEIAKKLGHKNSTYICNVEAGRKNPKLYNLAKLCKYYDVELGEFILFPQ